MYSLSFSPCQIELPEFSKSRFARRANMMDEAWHERHGHGGYKLMATGGETFGDFILALQ